MSDSTHPPSRGVRLNGLRLRQLRTRRGWSQVGLAKLAGVNHRTVSRMEAEELVQLSSAALIAEALKVTVEDLLAPEHVLGTPQPSLGSPAPPGMGEITLSLGGAAANGIAPEAAAKFLESILQLIRLGFTVRLTAAAGSPRPGAMPGGSDQPELPRG